MPTSSFPIIFHILLLYQVECSLFHAYLILILLSINHPPLSFSPQESDRKYYQLDCWFQNDRPDYVAALNFFPTPLLGLPSKIFTLHSLLSRLLSSSPLQDVCKFSAEPPYRGRIQGPEEGRSSKGRTAASYHHCYT